MQPAHCAIQLDPITTAHRSERAAVSESSRGAILKSQLTMRDAAAIVARGRVTHPTLEITEEQRARLKALGYVE